MNLFLLFFCVSRLVNQEYLEYRDGETAAVPAPRCSSPPISNNPSSSPPAINHSSQHVSNDPHPTSSPGRHHVGQATNAQDIYATPANQEMEAGDEFDPRIPVSGTESLIYLLTLGATQLFHNFINELSVVLPCFYLHSILQMFEWRVKAIYIYRTLFQISYV